MSLFIYRDMLHVLHHLISALVLLLNYDSLLYEQDSLKYIKYPVASNSVHTVLLK